MSGPCDWPVITSGVPGWDDADPEQQATATSVATYVLWALSGRRFGVCELTVRPELPLDRTQLYGRLQMPDGSWYVGGVRCDGGSGILLPGPAREITEVKVDGAVLPVDAYRLSGDYLWKTEGQWPARQLMHLPDTEPGTWSVTYTRGADVPDAGKYAAGVLAGEVLRSMRNASGCRLPTRARSVVREGVDIQLIDPEAFLQNGRVGIIEVDLFLTGANPGKLTRPPRVWSPDLPEYGA